MLILETIILLHCNLSTKTVEIKLYATIIKYSFMLLIM
jgi:hypothetical protein